MTAESPRPRSFAEVVTPAPAVDPAAARAVAESAFGVSGTITPLGSQHDANFRLDADGGGCFLLKFAHPSTSIDEITAQSLAADRFADAASDIAAPRTHAAVDGSLVARAPLGDDGSPLLVRMLDYVSGTPLSGDRYLAPAVVAQLGAYAARSVLALAGFEHPGTRRDLEWDLRNAGRVVDDLLPAVTEPQLAARIRSAMSASSDALAGLVAQLPQQVIHGDITDDNVVARAGEPGGRLDPCGIIDFGDVMTSWAVAELAVTCSSVLHHHGASAVSILPAVRAFQAVRLLSSVETDALWPLVVARAATLVVSAHHAAATDPGNEYTRANAAHEHRIFDVATSVPAPVMTELVRRAAGFEASSTAGFAASSAAGFTASSVASGAGGFTAPRAAGLTAPKAASSPPSPPHPLLPGLTPATMRVVDLSSTSAALSAGLFAERGAERVVAATALREGDGAVAAVTRFGERRLTRSFRESRTSPPCAALGIEVTVADPGQPVHAPWPGTIRRTSAAVPAVPHPRASTTPHPDATEAPTSTTEPVALDRVPRTDADDPSSVSSRIPVSSTFAVRLTAADGRVLELTGLRPAAPAAAGQAAPGASTEVRAGDLLGVVDGNATLGVRLLAGTAIDPADVPWFTTAELLPGWLPYALDPSPLLTGIDAVAGSMPQTSLQPRAREPRSAARLQNSTPPPADGADAAAELVTRRERHLAGVQEHYFADPPEIERGWRHHLFDTDARPYLDMVNNVAAVGHAHPRIADAVARQLNLLNTNSRFNYASIVELSERLAALVPDPLDTVFLVNSGTEAVDLALRLSWAWSGRRDVVAVREAYHGWSDAADAVSTSVADNPQALDTRPTWVHTLDAPNAYRGRHSDADAHGYASEAVAQIEQLGAEGRAPATFIAEPFYGNAGGMPLPDGYLQAVYPAIRAAGGLCIADEVQVGYGRLGEYFWGFEQQGVRPDIVTIAKAMGNGHPLGAVITTRAIADRYRSQGYFFSSAGGSPVSSVVGTTVLDILADEGLQQNARVVGAHLKARLEALAEKHELIGAVHGLGLYLGVELVRDRETREPATLETAQICERMRELGVIVQPTSDRQCVLKIKPPMTLTVESADYFADALDTVLTHGW